MKAFLNNLELKYTNLASKTFDFTHDLEKTYQIILSLKNTINQEAWIKLILL